jgi:hypothetical protein
MKRPIVVLLVAILLGTVCIMAVARFVIRSVVRGIESGDIRFGGVIWDDCPICGRRLTISPSQCVECGGCGNRVAACGWCGDWTTGKDIHEYPTGHYLCAEHYAEEQWRTDQLNRFAEATAEDRVQESPRSLAARELFESRIRATYASNRWPSEELFTPEVAQRPDQASFPATVSEAYRFYERTVMDNDFGCVDIFRWELDDSPVFIVRCEDDGGRGWLELYDSDGTPLGYARTDQDCPVWTLRNIVRRRTMVGDRDETDRLLPDAVKRLRGKTRFDEQEDAGEPG